MDEKFFEATTRDVMLDNVDFDAVVADKDELELAAQGKKQVTRSILGLALACSITWEGILATFLYGLIDGGPAIVYEFLISWIGFLAITASLAELASMAPTAGGSFHWVYLFAPPSSKKFLSYITGWLQVIAWQAVVASAAYLTGTIIQGLAILNYPQYANEAKHWHGTLLVYAVMLVVTFFNTVLGKFLPQVEGLILVLHLCSFVGILVPLVYLAPHGTAHDVFATFLSDGGYSSDGLTFLIGTISASFAFVGSDCPVHLCEEVKNASTVVPWAMVISVLINGLLGFAMVIAILFCIGDIGQATGTDTGYPFLEIFAQGVHSVRGATAMASFVSALTIAATISCFAGTSRMTWAFARDKGLPGSRWLGHVNPQTKLPLWSIALTTLVTLLLALTNIGSPVAFNALVSLVVSGFLGSYLLPIGLLIWMKLTKPEAIRYGPWSLGRLGLPINIFGVIWAFFAMLFSFFPAVRTDLTAQTMNWSCVMFGGTLIFAIAFYPLHGRRHFKGPVIETRVAEQLH